MLDRWLDAVIQTIHNDEIGLNHPGGRLLLVPRQRENLELDKFDARRAVDRVNWRRLQKQLVEGK